MTAKSTKTISKTSAKAAAPKPPAPVGKKISNGITKGAELPARMLDKTVVAGLHVKDALPESKVLKKSEEYWHMLGPGLTTGASDDDGGTRGAQSGNQFFGIYGHRLLSGGRPARSLMA